MSVKRSVGGDEYTVSYPLLGGVDLGREGRVSRERLAYAENMYRDYDGDGGGIIESIPGYRRLARLGGRINSIFMQRGRDGKRYAVIHAADKLYRLLPEEDAAPTLIGTANDGASRAFSHGYELYVLDGVNLIRVSEDGTTANVGSEEAPAYVPKTYLNGKEHEQRNFLTNKCEELVSITSVEDYAFGSPGITYRIIDAEARLCATVSAQSNIVGSIRIPSYTLIGTQRYKVVEIGEGTFAGCVGLQTVAVNEGVISIGEHAFCDCNSITKVYLPESLSTVGDEAFLRCTSLTDIYLGASLSHIGTDAFGGCTKLARCYYTRDISCFKRIEGYTQLSDKELVRHDGIKSAILSLPVYGNMQDVSRVYIGTVPYSFDAIYGTDRITSVIVNVTSRTAAVGKDARIIGTLGKEGEYDGLLPSESSGAAAITGNTVCEVFDGRAFLSGNPSTPSTVYWCLPDGTGRINPTYFGTSSYFSDGQHSAPVVELLSVSGSLAVFKDEDNGSGSIFYHTPLETGDNFVPKVYPVSYIHSGICAKGRAISFFDDPVFLTENGLWGIDKPTESGARTLTSRSRSVNRALLTERLSEATMARWCGYLAITVGERMYLADSRSAYENSLGERSYEWYLVTGIGERTGGSRVYRYSSCPSGDCLVHEDVDAVVGETVYSEKGEDGETCYYTEEGGRRYAVHPTEELTGGVLHPVTASCALNEKMLLFGTESGAVMVFNNDKRGAAPDFITDGEEREEYERAHKGRIHPSYYSFDGYAPRYAVRLRLDDCDIPYLTKSTVKNSLTLKCQVRGGGELCLECGTDTGGFVEACRIPNAVLDFSELDFSALSLSAKDTVSVSSAEKEKGWIEKQLSVYSDGFNCPIGIYSAAFRFTVKGRIKNN